ncbi:polyunsaturated fatty acid lipoxygenase ALOX15B-like [Xenentodon cancila]
MPVDYSVTIHLSDMAWASTNNSVYVTLVGEKAESERTVINSCISIFNKTEFSGNISCPDDLGEVFLIKLQKESGWIFSDDWLPSIAEVESPIGKKFRFPIYHWISDDEPHYFREGKAALCFQDNDELRKIRELEIKQQRKVYRCGLLGLPLPVNCVRSLTDQYGPIGLLLQPDSIPYFQCPPPGLEIAAMTGTRVLASTTLSCSFDNEAREHDYVFQSWMDDDFFGYQFLNGINPLLIRQCKTLPENFAVSGDVMLKEEMEKGNIFLCDYKILDGVKTNIINNKEQYLAAPLVLLRLEGGKMKPIAIQLKQVPGKDNPVFYPDDGCDWLLAKIFVRSADFNLHELNGHLLRTHLLAEVFAVSLQRNLPMVHPVYKLLIPHIRYTLFINTLARRLLISDDGVFTKFAASGGEGMMTIMKRSLETLTYSSLCIKDDIKDRGLEDVPNFYYKEDGEQLWNIMYRFVEEMLGLYYEDDNQVKKDDEVKSWISDMFKHGFLMYENSGIPEKFETRPELVKFVTMVMYTCSAQHSAVNTGQYDFYGWMPNGPSSLQLPPPTEKGKATQQTILATFPNIETTVNAMSAVWLLSKIFIDVLHLGNYPDKQFTEECSRLKIRTFQRDLKELSTKIQDRNKNLALPYTYLDPVMVENSVSV